MKRLLATLFCLLLPALLWGIDPRSDAVIGASDKASALSEDLTASESVAHPHFPIIMIYLILFAGLIWIGWKYFRHQGSFPGSNSTGKEGSISVLATRPLGNRQSLMVVQYEGKRILLGVGPGFISQLSELPPGSPAPEFKLPPSDSVDTDSPST